MPSIASPARRVLAAALALTSLVAVATVARAGATTDPAPKVDCKPRVLVVSAMPIELSPLLSKAKVSQTVTVDNRPFYVGRLRGHDVVLAMTRIGPVNATQTTKLALKTFRCHGHTTITAGVFSGVAGGDYIGNVAIPTRWTLDNGKSWLPVDRGMLRTARTLEHTKLGLHQKSTVGDPMCTCAVDPNTIATNSVLHKPELKVGGNGQTTDPFGGRAIPCVPGNNDVFGCDPCPAAKHMDTDVTDFPTGIAPFIGTGFFTGYLQAPPQSDTSYTAQDEETAAVDKVLAAQHIPFLGIRAASDGTATAGGTMPPGGDPLRLPGFPFTFFFYRQIASDNAAITTLAFLKAWDGPAS
jgi:nucleoside phosphorylase